MAKKKPFADPNDASKNGSILDFFGATKRPSTSATSSTSTLSSSKCSSKQKDGDLRTVFSTSTSSCLKRTSTGASACVTPSPILKKNKPSPSTSAASVSFTPRTASASSSLNSSTTSTSIISNSIGSVSTTTKPSTFEYKTGQNEENYDDDDVYTEEQIAQYLQSEETGGVREDDFENVVSSLDAKDLTMDPKCTNSDIIAIIVRTSATSMARVNEYPGLHKDPNSNNILKYHTPREELPGRGSYEYGQYSEDGELIKLGSSGNLYWRANDPSSLYCKEEGKFVILMNLESMPMELDLQAGQDFFDMLTKMINHPNVPWAYKAFCDTILNRGGYRLGAKKIGIRLIIESGLILMYQDMGNAREMGMFDGKKWELWNNKADEIRKTLWKTYAEHVLGDKDATPHRTTSTERVVSTVSEHCTTSILTEHQIEHLSSYPTYYCAVQQLLSVTVCILKSWTGIKDLDMTKVNVMPNPAFQGDDREPTEEEAFSDNYPAEKMKEAVENTDKRITKFSRKQKAVIVADQCNTFVGPGGMDRKFRIVGYDPKDYICGGEIRTYIHRKQRNMSIIHRPPGPSAESRSFAVRSRQIQRCIAMEGIQRFACDVRGVQQNKRYESPLLGGYLFHAAHDGLHLPLKVASAFAKDAVSPESVFACVENRLSKTPADPNYPVTKRNRDFARGYENTSVTTNRINDRFVIQRAFNLCSSFHCENENYGDESIAELFATIRSVLELGHSPDVSYRWESFHSSLDARDKPLSDALRDFDSTLKSNTGCATDSSRTLDEKERNAQIYVSIYGLPDKTNFWVLNSVDNVVDSDEILVTNIDDHPCYNIHYETLRNNMSCKKDLKDTDVNSFRSPRPPPGLKMTGMRKTSVCGKWKLCQVFMTDSSTLNDQERNALIYKSIYDLPDPDLGQFWVPRTGTMDDNEIIPDDIGGRPCYNISWYTLKSHFGSKKSVQGSGSKSPCPPDGMKLKGMATNSLCGKWKKCCVYFE